MTSDEEGELQARYTHFLGEVKKKACSLGIEVPRLCIVTKNSSVNVIKSLYEIGHRDFAENRMQVLHEKAKLLHDCPDIRWHFIGHLQSRKLHKLLQEDAPAKLFCLHSVHDTETLQKISYCSAYRQLDPLRVFIQANTSGESSKQGLSPDKWLQQIDILKNIENISVVGVMTMAPQGSHDDVLKKTFLGLKKFGQDLAKHFPSCSELSMGMSEDWHVALECGSTCLRIGRLITEKHVN